MFIGVWQRQRAANGREAAWRSRCETSLTVERGGNVIRCDQRRFRLPSSIAKPPNTSPHPLSALRMRIPKLCAQRNVLLTFPMDQCNRWPIKCNWPRQWKWVICVAVHRVCAAHTPHSNHIMFSLLLYYGLSVDQALNNKMNAIFHKLMLRVRWAIKAKNVCNNSFVSNTAERTAVRWIKRAERAGGDSAGWGGAFERPLVGCSERWKRRAATRPAGESEKKW